MGDEPNPAAPPSPLTPAPQPSTTPPPVPAPQLPVPPPPNPTLFDTLEKGAKSGPGIQTRKVGP